MRADLSAAAHDGQRLEAANEDVGEPRPEARTAAPLPPAIRSALLAAARAARTAQLMETPREDMEESTNATADPRTDSSASPPSSSSSSPRILSPRGALDPPSPVPLFSPGESLLSTVDVASVSTARRMEELQQRRQQQQWNEEEGVVRGLTSLSLGSEKPPSSSSRDLPPATSPGQVGLTGAATSGRLGVGAPERPPQAFSPQGASSSMWGRLQGMGGTHKQTDEVYPGTSAPGKLKQPRSHSPAQPGAGLAPVIATPKPDSAPPAPAPSTAGSMQNQPAPRALASPAKLTAAPGENPVETWLRAPTSIPSPISVIPEADIESIRNNLAFPSATSSQSPQAVGSMSGLTGGHRSRPGRDKLKAQEGMGTPYRRPSHPR